LKNYYMLSVYFFEKNRIMVSKKAKAAFGAAFTIIKIILAI